MRKRIILTIAAAAAGPLATLVAPAVARASGQGCPVLIASDTSRDGHAIQKCYGCTGLADDFFSHSTIVSRIEKGYGYVWFCSSSSTFHTMRGVVYCSDNSKFDNQFSQWVSRADPTPSTPDTIKCPSGFTGKSATTWLYDATKTDCSGGPQ